MSPHWLVLCSVLYLALARARSQFGDNKDPANHDIQALDHAIEDGKVDLKNAENVRVTNGSVAEEHQFPWQAFIYITSEKMNYICGGSLIKESWIMTAAHCFKNLDIMYVEVFLGAHDIDSLNSEKIQSFILDTSMIFRHPNFASDHSYDIALLKLPRNAVFNDYVQKIELTDGRKSYEEPGSTVTFSGWGKIMNGQETSLLLFANQTIASPKECRSIYYGSYKAYLQICVSGMGGKSVCNGDSGGPLVHYDNGTPKLIGITSFGLMGIKCEESYPKVFTRISHYKDFINSLIKEAPEWFVE